MNEPRETRSSNGIYGNATLLLIVTTLCWGANAVAGRIAVGEISPMALILLRWSGVVLMVLVFARRAVVAEWSILRPRLLYLTLLGALGFTGFNGLYYLAAHSTEAINIGIIQGSIPVFVLVGGYFIARTPVRPAQGLGVAITLIGVATLASRGEISRLAALEIGKGDVLMIAACVIYGGYVLALRRRPPVSGLAMFSVMAGAALVTSLPLAAIEAATGHFMWPTPTGWGVVLFVIVFPSFLSQLCFIRGVELIGPERAGVFVNLVPVFAAGLGVTILGERFEMVHGAALALVLAGIWLAERGKGG